MSVRDVTEQSTEPLRGSRRLHQKALIWGPDSNIRFLARAGGLLFLLPVASALLVSASFAPIDLGFLAWVGLSPFLFALRRSSFLTAAGVSCLFGLLFGLMAFSWVMALQGVNLPNYLLTFFCFCLYYVTFGLLYRLFSGRLGPWLLLGAPSLWVTLEYIRANLFFLSFPFNLLGHSQYRYLALIQMAGITGVYGLSFLIVMVNQFLSQLPELFAARRAGCAMTSRPASRQAWATQLGAVAIALLLTVSYGLYSLATPQNGRSLRVALVQANVLIRNNMPYRDRVEHLRAYERLTKEAAKYEPDLIVWPSAALPEIITSSKLVKRTVRRITSETGAFLLTGGAGGQKFGPRKKGYLPYSNSEFLISPSGRIVGQYNKIRLMPFNEYLPLQEYITWPKWITTLSASFKAGTEYTLFQVPGARFGTPICWDNMFPDLFRRFVKHGAQFMVTATNDGFFGYTAAPYQTLATNVFRAVENQVAVARANTTGVSAFISPSGEIVERVRDRAGEDLFVSGILVRDLPLSNHKTFYTVYGDIFAYLTIGMATWFLLASLLKHRWSGVLEKCANTVRRRGPSC